MNEESDTYLTKENYRATSETSDFIENRSRPGFISNDQSINFASNPFDEEYSSSFPLKKTKLSKDVELDREKNKFAERIFVDSESSKSSAIDALEQFKCSVRTRQKFTTPLGPSRVSAPKIFNTEISQLLGFNKEEKPKTQTRRKKDAPIKIKSPTAIQEESDVSSGQNDMMKVEESQKSPEKGMEMFMDSNEFEDKIPDWALKENAKDAKGRSQDDPNYDSHTLWIPPNALKGSTPLIQKYWEIKSQHFDEILLFQVGDFYRICYEDAVVCHRELNLNWLGNRMIVGVHRKSFDKCVETLLLRGFKVCVVEQTENYKGKKVRLKDPNKENKENTIKREVSQILSKGTFIDYNNPNYEPRYLLSLRIKHTQVAVTFLEIGYSMITFGYFDDDENFTTLKTLISQIKPTEVVYDRTSIDHNIIRYMRYLPGGPILTPYPHVKAWSSLKLAQELEKYYGAPEEWPAALKEITLIDTHQKEMLLMSFICIVGYLEQALLIDQILQTARYELYDPDSFKQSRMILDSQALSTLEITEVNYAGKNTFEGSLLSYIDKTSTRYGKRLLKNWICGPLLDIEGINQRLDALEDLELNWEMREKIRFQLKKLPDFERLCGKIYSSSIKKAEGIILFEDFSVPRLQEFRKILENFETARNLLVEMNDVNWSSELLKKIFILDDHKKIMNNESSNIPDILPVLQELSSFIVWEGLSKDVPTPRVGVDPEYDRVRDEINWIGAELEKYLEEIKARFQGKSQAYGISYVHTKHRYEIEVPVELVSGSKKPTDFEISSKKKGYERFVTEKIRLLVNKLEDAEEKLQASLKLFVCFVFRYFYTYNKVWDHFIKGLAQLDCLCSLSTVSFTSDSEMCRPELYPMGGRSFLEVRDMRHPCIAALKSNFVPNDILIGDIENNGQNKNIILLTGPNMGGKSTILRQACIASILAQIGCYVPAKICKLSIVDRIFTRIGACDRLIEGKSTFSIEMEETLNMLRYGTKNSLAILDELGRGTTTFDGISIAYSILKFIIEKLPLRTLFATHYHLLLDEFRNSPNIKFNFMDYRVDSVNERILFLYNLVEGECAKSFGLNISKIAGISQDVVEIAQLKAEEFDKEFHLKQNENKRIKSQFDSIIDSLNQMENLDDDIQKLFDLLERSEGK